ncbi:MAG: hypothetical protein J0G94_16335 [Sphingomonadales bacterium]|nr:hypothetical protein [Sphingomonadales bacterium]
MTWRMKALSIALATGLILPAAATASSKSGTDGGALRPLLDCRQIGSAQDRLACFDRESAALDQANERKEITVLDKEEVRKTRRSLFGFSLRGVPLLGGDDDENAPAEAKSMKATIASARSLGHGRWQFELEDGGTWTTLEPVTGRLPAAGKPVEIKRAALGSYLGNIDGDRAVRMRRVN